MAAGAAAQIHRRSQAVGDVFLFLEFALAVVEQHELALGEPRDGRARARGAGAWSGIAGGGGRLVEK